MSTTDTPPSDIPFSPMPPEPCNRHPLYHTPLRMFIPVFIILFFLIAFFAVYFFRDSLRQYLCSRFSRRHHRRRGNASVAGEKPEADLGLDPAIFPIVSYDKMGEGKVGPDCHVCLSEFAGGDEVRLLTVCCHAFHPCCIDPWLVEHATCPVCRSDLTVAPDEAALSVVTEALGGGGGRDSHVITFEDPNFIGRRREEEEGERSRIRMAGTAEEEKDQCRSNTVQSLLGWLEVGPSEENNESSKTNANGRVHT